MHEDADAVPELLEEYQLMRWTVRAEQSERLMCKAIRRGDADAVQRYRRFAGAACAACLDLLTN